MNPSVASHEEWLAKRRIGSSDAANVCKIEGAFGSPLETYLIKTGAYRKPQTDAMRIGTLLEPFVAQLYQEETGHEVRLTCPVGTVQSFYSERYPFASATPDRFAGEPASQWILELKTAGIGKGWGPTGTDEVPLPYLIQVQHQMAVLDRERADVAVLIGGNDFRWYTIYRHDLLIASMMAIEAEFWERVQRQEPPPIDWDHPDTPHLLTHLHRPNPKKTVDLGAFSALHAEEYVHLGDMLSEIKKRREVAKARLVDALQDAAIGVLPDGRRVRRQVKPVKGHTVAAREDIDFRILKPE